MKPRRQPVSYKALTFCFVLSAAAISCENHAHDGKYAGEWMGMTVTIELNGDELRHTSSLTPEIIFTCTQHADEIIYADASGNKRILKVHSRDTLLMPIGGDRAVYLVRK
jgi:hypothetical protein